MIVQTHTNGTVFRLTLAKGDALNVYVLMTHAEARTLVAAIEDTLVTKEPASVTVQS